MPQPTTGDHYLQRTVYEARELFAEVMRVEAAAIEPPRFKVYRGVPRFALADRLPLAIGDARWSLDGFAPAGRARPVRAALDGDALATLLYYSYGFSRRDKGPGVVWPDHRLVPSARCLFPTELYAWIPATGALPAGLYHYDNLHHALAEVRAGDLREEIAGLLGASLDDAVAVLFATSLLWKTAHKYHDYAYRLCAQEAGMVVGNALLVGGPLGLAGEVHYQLADADAERLLGIDGGEEHVFAAIALRPTGAPAERPAAATRAIDALPAVAPAFARGGFTYELPALLAGIAEASRQGRRAPRRDRPPAGRCTHAATIPAPPPAPRDLELADALRARSSGNVLFNPIARPLALPALWDVIAAAASRYRCDRRDPDAAVPVELHVAAFAVTELARGVYRYCAEHRGLHREIDGDVSRALQGAIAVPNLNLCSAAAVIYLIADVAAASAVYGDRAYRMVTMECGVIAQRICVLAAVHGLAARLHNGYDAQTVQRALGIADPARTPLFQIALAHNRPGVQVALPIVV